MSTSDRIPESLGAEPLSIAVISPDDVRRNFAIRALNKFPNSRIMEFVSYPPDIESVTRMLKKSFDVVIIDLDSDPEYTLELVENICAGGATNVIVYSESADPGLMVRCLRAGAREYLHTPITPTAMTEALVRAWSRRMEDAPEVVEEPPEEVHPVSDGKLLVFLSAKGGSGVTTLATSFALSLAEQSRERTLLIDLNLPLGDAALNLGTEHLYSTISAFENASRLDSQFFSSLLVQHKSGLWVLAGPSEMNSYQPTKEDIGTLLKVALQDFEYVVVDAGSKIDLQRSIRLDPTVTFYLVTQLGIPELRNANRLIKQFPVGGGPSLEIVLNRSDSGFQGIEREHVDKALTRPIRWRVPNDYAAVRRMQNSAIPLTQQDSPIAQAILQMTQSITGHPTGPENPEKKKTRSFFSFSL
jgi:pilus assembly protein CpaE